MRSMRVAVLCTAAGLVLAAALVRCGDGGETTDASFPHDTGGGGGVVVTERDGGPKDGSYVKPDGGPADTGGTVDDTGTTDDAGPTDDIGTADDAGPTDDTGTLDDAGTTDDTGIVDDGGIVEDTGPYDAGTASGKVVINEIMKIPSNGDPQYGQYVEIYNDSDDWADIDGWTLKADQQSLPFAKAAGLTEIAPRDYLVVGASDDNAKNSYAHVRYVWPPAFTLPAGSCALRLQDGGGVTRDAVSWTSAFPFANGSAIERKDPSLDGNLASSWQRAPALMTFLPETGEFGGDRGSPELPTYDVKAGPKVPIGAGGVTARIDDPRELWRFPVDVKAKDLMAFKADANRISGELDPFLSLVDAQGELVWKDLAYDDDLHTLDFWIYYDPPATGTLTMQVQADLTSSFDPAAFTAKAYVADWLDPGVAGNRMSIKKGEQFPIQAVAAQFSADVDAAPRQLTAAQLVFASSDAQTAAVDAAGVITGVKVGWAVILVTYKGGSQDLVAALTVDVQDDPANDTCDKAIDISGMSQVQGSTIFATDDYDPAGCLAAFYTGPDVVYSFSSAAAQTWRFTITPFWDYNPLVYIFDSCPPVGTCAGGTMLMGKGEAEVLEFQSQPNKPYHLFVDGDLTAGTDKGTFTLKIEKL